MQGGGQKSMEVVYKNIVHEAGTYNQHAEALLWQPVLPATHNIEASSGVHVVQMFGSESNHITDLLRKDHGHGENSFTDK